MTVAVAEKVHDGGKPVDNVDKWCGAKTRPGAKYPTCHQAKGWGTDHPGEGRCKLHGGKSPSIHGRYSTVSNHRIRDLYQRHAQDPDPTNTFPELFQLRALAEDYVNRYQESTDALIAWHLSWRDMKPGEEGPTAHRPVKVLDLASAVTLLDTITKVAERIENIRAQNAISWRDLRRLMDAMGAVVEREVKDEDVTNRIRDGWLTLLTR